MGGKDCRFPVQGSFIRTAGSTTLPAERRTGGPCSAGSWGSVEGALKVGSFTQFSFLLEREHAGSARAAPDCTLADWDPIVNAVSCLRGALAPSDCCVGVHSWPWA